MDNMIQILEGLGDTRGGGRCIGCGVSGVGGLGAPGAQAGITLKTPLVGGITIGTALAVGAAYFLFFRGRKGGRRRGLAGMSRGRRASGSIIPR